MAAPKSLQERLSAARRAQVSPTTGQHTAVSAPGTAPVAPAAVAQAAPSWVAARKAALKGEASDFELSVDPRIAAQTTEQARAAVHANNLIADSYRAQAAKASVAKPNPFARQVVAPPPELLAQAQRGQAQAANWVAGHGDVGAAQEALRERAVQALPLAPRPKTGSEGSDGAVMRKTTFASIPVFVETDVGQARKWTDPKTGEERATIMRFPYGYIPETTGMDDGSVDVFVGPVSDAKNAYVILINKPPTFDAPDEEKVFLGFTNIYDAIGAFLQHYGNEERFIRKVNVVPTAELAKSLLRDGHTGTAEGSTKTESHDSHPNKPKSDDKPPVLEKDPTSSMVDALEDKPKIDEKAVKTAAAALVEKIAGAPSRFDEAGIRKHASFLAAKIAAEAAATSLPGFAPYNTTTESVLPDTGSVQDGTPDGTVYPETRTGDMFRDMETNSMQTDHLVAPDTLAAAI